MLFLPGCCADCVYRDEEIELGYESGDRIACHNTSSPLHGRLMTDEEAKELGCKQFEDEDGRPEYERIIRVRETNGVNRLHDAHRVSVDDTGGLTLIRRLDDVKEEVMGYYKPSAWDSYEFVRKRL